MGDLRDESTEAAVKRLLEADTRIDASEIEVTVEDDIAFLSGSVDGAAERQAIIEIVKTAASIRNVVNRLLLRNYIERTNDELKESVRNALRRDISLDAGLVTVEASGGEVTLRGYVESFAQKNAIEDVAWWISGVTEVINCIEVADESGVPLDLKD